MTSEPPTKFNEKSTTFRIGCSFLISSMMLGIAAWILAYGESTFTTIRNFFAEESPATILGTLCLVFLILGWLLMSFTVEDEIE